MICGQWSAEPGWQRIDLLSDVHLHPEARLTFEAWRAHMLGTPADAVLILGDLFEVWVGDDSRDGDFERECVDVLREAASRRHLAFMHGNRDFLMGAAMRGACGMQALPDPTVAEAWQQRVLLTHGDALCLADTAYQQFRIQVRSPEWQASFLALPLHSRQQRAQAMRDASQQHQAAQPAQAWADADAPLATRWMHDGRATSLVHGHTHRPATHVLPNGQLRHVLGDWDFEAQPPRARALAWTAAGLHAFDVAAST